MTELERVTLSLPSKGALSESTVQFLSECGLKPVKDSPRQYAANISALPGVSVLFQRTEDIAPKVADGTVDLGVTGLDIVLERADRAADLIVLHDSLGYGQCDLLIAVPETWIDVDSLADVAEIALEFREDKGRDLRIATKFPNLTRQFLLDNGVSCFSIVAAHGAIEGAPAMGYSDIIADLSSTGSTLRANHMKPLNDGLVLSSQACLIGNMRALREKPYVLRVVRSMLEMIDATLQGKKYNLVTANVTETSARKVIDRLLRDRVIDGEDQVSISGLESLLDDSPSSNPTGHQLAWAQSLSITLPQARLLSAVACLRELGATNISVSPVKYRFMGNSESYAHLVENCGLTPLAD